MTVCSRRCLLSDELQKVLETNYIEDTFTKEAVVEMVKEVSIMLTADNMHLLRVTSVSHWTPGESCDNFPCSKAALSSPLLQLTLCVYAFSAT